MIYHFVGAFFHASDQFGSPLILKLVVEASAVGGSGCLGSQGRSVRYQPPRSFIISISSRSSTSRYNGVESKKPTAQLGYNVD
jgi:hypothetical protein